MSLSQCGTNADGVLKHLVYPEVVCFSGIHVLHVAISYLVLILFILIVYITTILNYENRYTRDPTSKINATSDLVMLLQQTIYVFFFTFFSQSQYALFKVLLLALFSVATYASIVSNRPYYSPTTQILVEIFSGIFAWVNLVLLGAMIISSTNFTGALEILFLGIPIILLLIYTRQEDRNKLLLTAETQIESGDLCQKKFFYYIYIIETKEMLRQSAIILKGYVNHHSEVCPVETCPIKAFKRMILKDRLSTDTSRKKKIQN